MRKQTAEKVADLLGLVEQWLADGRPRKSPGKPRPDAVTFDGYKLRNPSVKDIWCLAKVSLPAALRLAAKEQGYGRYVTTRAADEILWAYDPYQREWNGPMIDLEKLDNDELDTRELLRAARAARRYIEKGYLS